MASIHVTIVNVYKFVCISFNIILLLFYLSFLIVVSSEDVCLDLDNFKLSQVHKSATPIGRARAGKYVRDNSANTLSDCIFRCCEADGVDSSLPCNVAFFSNGTCYHITCNTSHPDLCDYETRHSNKFIDTYYMIIRPVCK